MAKINAYLTENNHKNKKLTKKLNVTQTNKNKTRTTFTYYGDSCGASQTYSKPSQYI